MIDHVAHVVGAQPGGINLYINLLEDINSYLRSMADPRSGISLSNRIVSVFLQQL
jgi:hypothetical protein